MEFRVFCVRLVKLGLEKDHHPVLKEVVVLDRVGVETLSLEIVKPAVAPSAHRRVRTCDHHLLLLVHVDLEADDITVLNLALRERQLGLHELYHAGFDFLDRQI